MLTVSIFSTVEFYVVMAVIAAAIVAFAARPRTPGAVTEHLLGSTLDDVDTAPADMGPSVEFRCREDGHVTLIRRGLEDISMSGAVSIAATFDGMNLAIEERLTPGSSWDGPAREAVFDIDFLRPGRYHVTYNSQKAGLFVAMHLHVRPGLVATRILSR